LALAQREVDAVTAQREQYESGQRIIGQADTHRQALAAVALSWDEGEFLVRYRSMQEDLDRDAHRQLDLLLSLQAAQDRIADLLPIEKQRTEYSARLREIEDALEPMRTLISDLTVLSDVLLGIRMSIIEAAKPEVEEITNELLSVYEDGRFRIVLNTSSTVRGSSKERDDFVPRIFDTKDGVYKSSGSGGQQAGIDEALRLGTCIFNAMKYKFDTLFRDETTANLTRDHAADYVSMLRKAQELGKFHQIILVTHHETIWKQADVILEIRDGALHERHDD